jgi:hypothetical protein
MLASFASFDQFVGGEGGAGRELGLRSANQCKPLLGPLALFAEQAVLDAEDTRKIECLAVQERGDPAAG